MDYIVIDFEFNQAYDLGKENHEKQNPLCPFEIIQIGAVKLNSDLEYVDQFNKIIKPVIYKKIHPFVEKITGITQQTVKKGTSFSKAYSLFSEFVKPDDVLCTWGVDDIKYLFKNILFHGLDYNLMPLNYLNIQDIATKHLKYTKGQAIGLKNAVMMFDIDIEKDFHDAYNDAYYTAEIFKKINPEIISIKNFDINSLMRKKSVKTSVNTKELTSFFEQFLERKLEKEEIRIIKKAYILGKKGAFDMDKY